MFYVLYLGIMIGIFYLLFYRPQKKEQKKRAALVNSVEVGDSILTTSGFYGIVIDITDEDVIVEFGNNKNCRIPMKKAAIEQVEKPE
ncbi:MAG: preprotein translocase subunit YajC [Lachnospiraceae bacterium]|nr:preprotein translocase subunit YajC [Lachnospiraceae bacterium]